MDIEDAEPFGGFYFTCAPTVAETTSKAASNYQRCVTELFKPTECGYFGQDVANHTRIFIDKTRQVVRFVEETETQVTIVIEPKNV